MIKKRGSGILFHITSLPSIYGVGDLGPEAYKFADFLSEAGQSHWLILPLNETSLTGENSPYHSFSTFSGNTLLISPDILKEEGWLEQNEVEPIPDFPEDHVDYQKVTEYKSRLYGLAFNRFKSRKRLRDTRNFVCKMKTGCMILRCIKC